MLLALTAGIERLDGAHAVLLALPGVAQAHVSIQPGTTEGGGFSVIAFRVPNERDDASTTRLQVTLPEDQPIGSVQTTAIPGWRITTQTRRLDEPIDLFGEQLDSVVSKVTWTATAGGIHPGQFQDFDLLGAGAMRPEESTTPAVLWLLSDDARFYTGQVLTLDAGASIRPVAWGRSG